MVADIENAMMSEPDLALCLAERLEKWRAKLTEVLARLDDIERPADTDSDADTAATVVGGAVTPSVLLSGKAGLLKDKPAAMIRRGARAKAGRLLALLPRPNVDGQNTLGSAEKSSAIGVES